MPSSLEKEMATHSSMLAWEIPWTEEPGGLQSMALQESIEHICSEGMLKKERHRGESSTGRCLEGKQRDGVREGGLAVPGNPGKEVKAPAHPHTEWHCT